MTVERNPLWAFGQHKYVNKYGDTFLVSISGGGGSVADHTHLLIIILELHLPLFFTKDEHWQKAWQTIEEVCNEWSVQSRCEHVKVFANDGQKWICRECGAQGVDSEYEDLLRKKRTGGFQHLYR